MRYRIVATLGTVLFCAGTATLSAALKDMLKPELRMEKPNEMREKTFDTKLFQTKGAYNGMKQFKVSPMKDLPGYKSTPANSAFEKQFAVPEKYVFTGREYLPVGGPVSDMAGKQAPGFDGRYKTEAAPGLSAESDAMAKQTYVDSGKQYRGPELDRKTTEIELINQTLRNKESLKGEVLSMQEVREILNKRE